MNTRYLCYTALLFLFCSATGCASSDQTTDAGCAAEEMRHVKTLYEMAYVIKETNPESALRKLDEALELVPPENVYYHKILRLKARIEGRPEPDIQAIDLTPPDESPTVKPTENKEVRFLLNKSKKLVRERELEEAAELLEKAIRLEAENCHTLVTLGIVYARRGLREKSAEWYEKFLKSCPHHMQAPQIRSILNQYYEFKGLAKRVDPPAPVSGRDHEAGGTGKVVEMTAKEEGLESKGLGIIDVGVSGDWAFVYVDGAKIRATPLLHYRLKAGEHVVELIDREGRRVQRWDIHLQPGKLIKLLHTPQ